MMFYNWNEPSINPSVRIKWRASLVPAAAVIPAPWLGELLSKDSRRMRKLVAFARHMCVCVYGILAKRGCYRSFAVWL